MSFENRFANPLPEEESAKRKKAQRKRQMLIGAAAISASAAVHAPFAPGVVETYREIKDFIQRPMIHPQSLEQRLQVLKRKIERKLRIDHDDLQKYREETAQQLERGEDVDGIDLVFDLEKKNGMPEAEVEAARKLAHADVEKYVREFGAELDVTELDRFSKEMYANAQFTWGETSATDYYIRHIRDCVAIARVQQMVLDGVVKRMASDAQKTWTLGTMFQHQHEVFTVKEFDPRTSMEKAQWALEDGAHAMTEAEKVGTATISLDQVKQALVSSKPVVADANQGGGKVEIDPGVNIDAPSDEPAPLNVSVRGKLRGSTWRVAELQKEGFDVKPIEIPYIHEEGAMEVEILPEQATKEDADRIIARDQDRFALEIDGEFGLHCGTFVTPDGGCTEEERKRWDNPSIEAIELVASIGNAKEVAFRDPKKWNEEQFLTAFRKVKARELSFEMHPEYNSELSLPQSFFDAIASYEGSLGVLKFSLGGSTRAGAHEASFSTYYLHKLLAEPKIHTIELAPQVLTEQDLEELERAPVSKYIILTDHNMMLDTSLMLEADHPARFASFNPKARIFVRPKVYKHWLEEEANDVAAQAGTGIGRKRLLDKNIVFDGQDPELQDPEFVRELLKDFEGKTGKNAESLRKILEHHKGNS